MDLTFDRGDQYRPKGHALLYFRVTTEPDTVYATYVVTLPVKADLTKYVPPFLATHLGSMPLSDFSAFAMPPVPEPVDSYQELQRLSQLRDDDLVYGDSMFSFDLPRMMEAVTEAVQVYSELCTSFFDSGAPPAAASIEQPGQSEAEDDVSLQVNQVLFSLMSESDKLTELSRMLGKLRFAQDGQDHGMADEVTDEIKALARYLPEQFQLPNLLAAAQDATQRGAKLAQLYLDRCFRLSSGDSSRVEALEEEIQSLRDER